MPHFAANLTLMYGEHAFPERFAAARDDGFDAVECLFPYAWPAQELAARLKHLGLRQVLFNAPPGDLEQGERGLAALPGRREAFRRGFLEQALPYATALCCPRLHVMAGLVPSGADPAAARAYFKRLFETVDTDERGIQKLRERLDYPETARQFRMIDDQGTISVAVHYGSEKEQQRVGEMLERLRRGAPEARTLLRRLQPYFVSLRGREAERYTRVGLISPVLPGVGEWLGAYDPVRGVVGNDPEPDALVV